MGQEFLNLLQFLKCFVLNKPALFEPLDRLFQFLECLFDRFTGLLLLLQGSFQLLLLLPRQFIFFEQFVGYLFQFSPQFAARLPEFFHHTQAFLLSSLGFLVDLVE